MRLDPKHPVWYLYGLGHAYYLVNNYEQAIANLEKAIEMDARFWPSHLILALSFDAMGRIDESQEAVNNALAQNKNIPYENWEKRVPYKDPAATQKKWSTH